MKEYIGGDLKNNLSTEDKELLSSKQESENNSSIDLAENDLNIQSAIAERKSIKTILFVDDEEPIRKLFKEALERFGYEVVVAPDGKEGMKLFKEHPADLIITDIFMPEMDGHTFIHEILQAFPEANIFAITGKKTLLGIENELDIAKTLGAKSIFSKPVKLRDVLDAINALLLPPKTVTV